MHNLIKIPRHYSSAQRLLLHLLFWFCIAALYTVSYKRIDKQLAWALVSKDLIALTSIFYFTSYVIIPEWLMKGKFVLSVFWIVIIYLWWGGLTYFSCLLIHKYLSPSPRLGAYINIVLENRLAGLFKFAKLPFYVLDFIYLTALPLGLKIMQSFARVRRQKVELELTHLELELSFLKTQINPHFLFNTLNNIYILVAENNPEAPTFITKLSGIMKYLLHESNLEIVSLGSELTFIKNYIELEKLRFNEKVKIEIEIETDSERYSMVPLILFPFVENAFKHGPKESNKKAWVILKVFVHEGILNMNVSNGSNNTPKPIGYVGGIGIENVRKRLELNYKNAFQLDIDEKEDAYSVNLKLKLEDWD